MFSRRWPAYSAVLLLAIGITCLVALLVKQPPIGARSAVAAHAKSKPAAAVAMPSSTSTVRASRTS